jgi:3-methylcrotonyl-CoA carboxylase alpha subunit
VILHSSIGTYEAEATDPQRVSVFVRFTGNGLVATKNGQTFVFNRPSAESKAHGTHDGEIEAPMPGKVTAVEISNGEKVAKGQRLLTLEAMKMEHALTAPFDGTVAELNTKAGAQVSEGQLLAKVTPED